MFEKNKTKEEKDKKEEKKKGIWDRVFKKKKLKKNKVAVLYLRNNGIAETYELESKKGFFNVNNKTYHENRDCIYTMGKDRFPLAIIPEWSLIPIGTKKWEDKNMLEKFAELQDHTLRGIRHAELVKMGEKDSKGIDNKTIIIIGIIVIIALAFFLGR